MHRLMHTYTYNMKLTLNRFQWCITIEALTLNYIIVCAELMCANLLYEMHCIRLLLLPLLIISYYPHLERSPFFLLFMLYMLQLMHTYVFACLFVCEREFIPLFRFNVNYFLLESFTCS